ncbi:hypothetical protein TKK_0018774 [Trichogramma kaykai]
MCTLMNSAQSQLMVKKKDPEKGGFASNVIKVGNKEIFASDFSEKDVVTGKNGEKSIDNPADNKLLLKNLVQYEKIDGVKHGMCLLCGKDNKGNFLTSIPMKNSNTSGVKSHFSMLTSYTHILNLAVQDILKMIEISNENQSLEEEDESSSYAENDPEDSDQDTDNSELTTYSVANLVKKIHKLHCKIRNSKVLCQKLENCCTAFDIKYKKPISDTKTRWNSKFDMLHTAASLKEALDQMCKKNDALKIYTIKASEWILLKEFSTTDCEEPVPKKLKIDEEDSLDIDILFVKPSTSSISEKELNNYLESPRPEPDTNILIWWKTYANVYPIIARIARDVLCIPATSVPVERLFSEASLVLTKNRCSLNSQDLRELICINRWMHSDQRNKICEINY